MTKCKNCNEADKTWHHDPNTGKWQLLNADGSRHFCMSGATGISSSNTQPQQTQQTATVIEHQQGTMATYEVAHVLDSIDKRIQRIEEYYGDLVELLKAVTQSQTKNQQMADAEARYDQNKEDDSI